MSEELLAPCGYRCDLCPAYRATLADDLEALAATAAAWEELYGFHLEADEVRCDGCHVEGGRRIDAGCPVRPCVRARGHATCAACDDYRCEALRSRQVSRGEVEERLGRAVSDETYHLYVRPFEGQARLDALRPQR